MPLSVIVRVRSFENVTGSFLRNNREKAMPIAMSKPKIPGATTLLDKLGLQVGNLDYAERQKQRAD